MNSAFLVFTILNISLTLLALIIYDNITLRKYIKSISYDEKKYTSKDDIVENEEELISSYEMERIAREREMDKRIEMLKRELEYANPSKGHTAEELDPNVYNLPHDVITQQYDYEVDEVAY